MPPAATVDGASAAVGAPKAGLDAHTAAAPAGEAGKLDEMPSASAEHSRPLQDEDLFYMDEAEAIRQIEKEIEEQIERNHYKALGI